MLDSLFVTASATAVIEALGSALGAAGSGDGGRRIAVVGHAKLAGALAAARLGDAPLDVIPVGLSARAARKLPHALDDTSTIAPRTLAAVVGVDVATDDTWADTVAAWSRVVRDGGAIVLVDRGHAAEASRRALCAGLGELEQRHAGRSVITSGLVTHLETQTQT